MFRLWDLWLRGLRQAFAEDLGRANLKKENHTGPSIYIYNEKQTTKLRQFQTGAEQSIYPSQNAEHKSEHAKHSKSKHPKLKEPSPNSKSLDMGLDCSKVLTIWNWDLCNRLFFAGDCWLFDFLILGKFVIVWNG